LLAILALDDKFDFVDDSYYIMLAKSLAGGFGYSDINLPVPVFHDHFPPGLPLLLSVPTLFGFDLSTTVILYKLLLIACGAVSLYLFARLATEEGFSSEAVSSATLLSAVSIVFVGFTTRVGSEMLYSMLSVAALIAFTRYERASIVSRRLLVLALFLVACVLTRSIGFVLIGSAFLTLLLKRDLKRAAVVGFSAGLLWLPWFLMSRSRGSGIAWYSHEFLSAFGTDSVANITRRVLYNGWLLLDRDIPRVVFSLSSSEFIRAHRILNAVVLPVRLGISAVVIVAILVALRRQRSAAAIYVTCYVLLISVWPTDPSRYIVPMAPFLCLAFVWGAWMILERRSELMKFRRTAMAGLLAACIASHLITDARAISVVRRSGHYTFEAASIWNETMTAYEWIRQNTPPSSVIGCQPAIGPHVFLFTGRKALPLTRRPETYPQLGISHILYITDPTMYDGPEVRRRPGLNEFIDIAGGKLSLNLVYRSADMAVFEMK
jgi:hypothetical protein